ncbi:hypothetical protein QRX50_03120 [Amycolatopsis carbonis]|uniref:Uncharacterized protein n=1 Tax=Amycolatopsis carbonis TaxID=715471 RepID=A0A9Y2IIV9_9PSEU|nr:hypothetical protein [Amycolatopsis sp. 2-15]WIX79806.1 hypothetical protein QRX50_03120 [Amycolatopsis sp. 2-15]
MIDNLPPRRELPPEVRDRIRLRVRAGLDEATRPAHRRRSVWLVAAAVVVVATGVVFATGVPRGDSAGPLAPAAPRNSGQEMLDRCWNAMKPYYPEIGDPRGWNIPFTLVHGDATVTAAMIGDQPLFCETTLTTVTISDPDAPPAPVPGTKAKVYLRTADGLVAGLADPAWRGVQAVAPGVTLQPDGPPAWWLSSLSHQFAVFTGAGPAVPLALGPEGAEVDPSALVSAPAALTVKVDRPASAERRSEAGMFLDECLASSAQQVPDRGAYVAGAFLSWNNRKLIVARLGQHVLTCSARPDPGKPGATYYAVNPSSVQDLKPGAGGGALAPVLAPVKETGEPERLVFAGGVPENVTRVSVTYPGGQPKDAVVAHGTFAIWHTDADNSSIVDGRTDVKAYDAAGNVVIEASLKLF